MVRPIVPPTVPEGTQRVRVCLHAGNTFDDMQRLVDRIKEWLDEMGTSQDLRQERRGARSTEVVKAAL